MFTNLLWQKKGVNQTLYVLFLWNQHYESIANRFAVNQFVESHGFAVTYDTCKITQVGSRWLATSVMLLSTYWAWTRPSLSSLWFLPTTICFPPSMQSKKNSQSSKCMKGCRDACNVTVYGGVATPQPFSVWVKHDSRMQMFRFFLRSTHGTGPCRDTLIILQASKNAMPTCQVGSQKKIILFM